MFKEIQLGDIVPIASRYGTDYHFKVVDKIIYEFPESGLVEVWVLDQLNSMGGIAYYERSKGILLNGTFIYDTIANDTYNFMGSNANFTYVFLPAEFHLTSNAGTPDKDGSFILSWNSSDKAIDYSVYQSFSHIDIINDNLTSLIEHSTSLSLQLEDYSDGTYYFIVEACNEIGTILSNCIEVEIQVAGSLTQAEQALVLILGGLGMLSIVGIAIILIHKRNVERIA